MFLLKQSSNDLPILSLFDRKDLSLQSTLIELSLHDFSVESSCLGIQVAEAFNANPLLPGIILTDQGQFLGMMSRRRFLEHMSRPYGLELFLKRPIKSLYVLANTDTLVFPGNTLIVSAVRQALQRQLEELSEPIIVEIQANDYKLLDLHQLLVAQSQVHELANQLIIQLYQQLQQANQELKQLATVDGLTKLANRRQFDEYLYQKYQQMQQAQLPLSLILCDVDFFKSYNDTYGHLAGDLCLQQVAKAISLAVKRAIDLVARYGGEEFAAILPNTDADGATHVAEQMRKGVRDLLIAHEKSAIFPYVTISLGIVTLTPNSEFTPINLIEAADKALYQAKASGRDRYVFYT